MDETEQAIQAVKRFSYATFQTFKSDSKAAAKREEKTASTLLQLILKRKPTPDEVYRATRW